MSKSPKKGKSPTAIVIPDYISELPDAIPPGRILVHNDVRPVKRLGHRGFRAWLSFPEPRCVILETAVGWFGFDENRALSLG